MAPLEAGESHGGKIAQLVEEVDRHLAVEDPHVGQVMPQPVAAPQGPVERRAMVGAHQADEIIDQPEIGDEIPLHPEQAADHPVEPLRAERGDRPAERGEVRLFLPAAPDHAEMGVIKLMGEEAERPFRMEVGISQPVGCRAVAADEQGEKMLGHLDGQIAHLFFVRRGKARRRVGESGSELPAPEADVRAVVGEAHIGDIGEHHQVVGDDPRLPQLGDPVELAARQDLVAELHVAEFFLSPVPAGEAGAHEQFPVEGVGDMPVELFLANRGVGRGIDHGPLPACGEGEALIGVHHQELRQEQAFGCFTGNGPPHAGFGPEGNHLEGKGFRRGVVVQEVAHEPLSGFPDNVR